MTTAPRRLGPYTLGAELGAGGMGVVYRARDERLGRDVAVKVLPPAFRNPDRLRRFEAEARAAAALSHPNVLALFDVGSDGDEHYLVTELLEGRSLAALLADGPPPLRRALSLGAQLARGLAAAHERKIVHRDLKPSNLFVTVDGTLKILDFGLAKVVAPEVSPFGETQESGGTLSAHTSEGAILGTVGYMAPEQVQGRPADARSDLFAVGCVLYELLAGRRAFDGPTAVETSYAILRDEPAPLPPSVPVAVARVVRRCLEKEPAERFQSARDLSFALEALDPEAPSQPSVAPASAAPPSRRRLRGPIALGAIALAAAGFGVGALAMRARPSLPTQNVRFTQVTFRPALIAQARFVPGSANVVYTSLVENLAQVVSGLPGTPEVRPVTDPDVELYDISPKGELALGLGSKLHDKTLARASLMGGAPRPLLENVSAASFAPDGESLMVIHEVDGVQRVELPIGHVLIETRAWMVRARLSPRGDRIALVEYKVPSYGIGQVEVLELDGRRRALTETYQSIGAPVWSPDGREIWFSTDGTIRAVTLDGKSRVLLSAPSDLTLRDTAPDGRVLLATDTFHHRVSGTLRGAERERDLSWFELSDAPYLPTRGDRVLTTVLGLGKATDNRTYLRGGDRAPAVQLSDGNSLALSPDGAWAVVGKGRSYSELELVPTGPGTSRALPRGTIELVTRVFWFADGKTLLVVGREPGRPMRVWRLALDGGQPPRPISDEGVITAAGPSPDGQWVAAYDLAKRQALRLPADGGAVRPIDKLPAGILPIGWSDGGAALFVRTLDVVMRLDGYVSTSVPVKIERFDLASGARTPWRTLAPPEPGGESHIDVVSITPDGGAYAYAYGTRTSLLYVAEGLR